jgi:hypothetical protein
LAGFSSASRVFVGAGSVAANALLGFGMVARTQSYLAGRGADFEQVLVSTTSR